MTKHLAQTDRLAHLLRDLIALQERISGKGPLRMTTADSLPHIMGLIEARSALRLAAFKIACAQVAAGDREEFRHHVEKLREKANDLELELQTTLAIWTDRL